MTAIADLLDRAKAARSITSDAALAQRIGRSRALLSEWRKGIKAAQDDDVAELAELAREPADAWLVKVRAEQATGASRKHWMQLSQRVSIAAAVALLAFALPQENALISGISVAASLPMHIMFGATATLTAAAAWWVLHMENRRG